MKKLMYLLVAGTMFIFTACNCGAGDAVATDTVEEVVAEDAVETEEVAEAVGCQVEGGTCLEDHSCCAPAEEAVKESHEGHDHGAEGHSHE
jgi:bacterioferritin-associated ferredoxin